MIAILVNVASFLLAIYLSLHGKNRSIRQAVWLIACLLTIGNVYVQYNEYRKERIYFDILAPNMTSKYALSRVTTVFQNDLKELYLVDVIGSYYICFKKPDRFFHQFPEWVFVFRKGTTNRFVEFRVFDSRIPPIPRFKSLELKDLLNPTHIPNVSGGTFVSFITLKVTPEYLGIHLPYGDDDRPDPSLGGYILSVVDEEGRSLVELTGGTSADFISEVVESTNDKVFARVRVTGRATDYIGNRTILEDPGKLGKIAIAKSDFEGNEFYQSLKPIENWDIDVDQAILNAIDKGALAIPPDKLGMAGGPGIFRLLNKPVDNLDGVYWRIPYRVGIRPLLVSGTDGSVYAMDNSGNFATRWEENFILKELTMDNRNQNRGK